MMRATASTPVQANYFGSMQIEMVGIFALFFGSCRAIH